ncbi:MULTISPECIES: fimbrial protein [Pseudomonas]|uniref:fimbrial protein n=1 Tax=Pseudomonas nitroreducens TaxID=46680 RepID=UPI001E34ECB6|nr:MULTISPECIES: fimbrial protein [Pseudomonas]MCE4072673.1 fimbrial protein [Pseudomonas nitritireducens]MCE4082148.1 fimbrial protein [Pseudomonas nitroreducens]
MLLKYIMWLALLGGSLPAPALATCYRVYSSSNTPANDQISPADGLAVSSWGACDTCSGSLGLPSVINVTDSSFQPYGTLLASSTAPFTAYGRQGGYNAETVFARCQATDAVYEMYSTNADDRYSGWYPDGDALGVALGLPSAFRTAWPNVLLRLTNQSTGSSFTPVWQQRLLTGLDSDSRGYVLIKAKNLSAVRAELFSAGPESTNYYSATTKSQSYDYSQPAAYIALKGPGLTYPQVGVPHSQDYNGWYGFWPGAISLYKNVTLKRYQTCSVVNITPVVLFPTISVAELNAGGKRVQSFNIKFNCQTGATVNSVALNATAMGIKASPGAVTAASTLGLSNASGGLSYLLSDDYGQPGMAGGVGIRIFRNDAAINLLANENSAAGAATANAQGWYPAVSPASQLVSSAGGVNQYAEMFSASLEKLSIGTQPPVTPGKVKATAQLVIRVQ